MTVSQFNFTTGQASLPDVGELSYNGVKFSPLFETHVSGTAIKDNAERTVKFMEYVLEVDGYVTLPAGASSIAPTMATLRRLLNQQGGALVYRGRGFDLIINPVGGGGGVGGFLGGPLAGGGGGAEGLRDVAWGPVPEILEFQPLGAGRSAKVQWKVTVRIPESRATGARLLQFNYETELSYGEDYYATFNIHGTMEIPMTRLTVDTRTLTQTVDNYREELNTRIFNGINLAVWRVVRRDYPISRDKRTLEFNISLEEKPYMDLPPDCPVARGSYSVKPAKAGAGLISWLCTLRASYTVAYNRPRRSAWVSFLQLLRLRMRASEAPGLPDVDISSGGGGAAGGGDGSFNPPAAAYASPFLFTAYTAGYLWGRLNRDPTSSTPRTRARRAWLIDFSFDEGLYLDSKTTVSFSASWRLIIPFSHILKASGIWRKVPEYSSSGNIWAINMRDISGASSCWTARLDPSRDIIVDFGST